MLKQYFSIFLKCLLVLLAGAALGFIFFYFFKDASVFITDKFKILQGVFGIREYREGMSFNYILVAIFLGNLLSTLGYFGLGYLKAALPLSFVTGVFTIIFLFSGTIRHGTSIPGEVIILFSIEMFYRVMAMTTGEYINRNKFKNKAIPISSMVIIFAMLVSAVFYELYQIF